jgi:hypothetical protein
MIDGSLQMSFGYFCGGDATILVSKMGGRYRLQAGTLEALTMLSAALCDALNKYFSVAANNPPPGDGK